MTERRQRDSRLHKDAPGSPVETDDEGAPDTESPETPKIGAKAAKRAADKADALETPTETPERPAPPQTTKTTATTVTYVTHATRRNAESGAVPVVTRPAPVTVLDEIAELQHHVAQNPTDAHAPAWLGRAPNGL